MNARDLLSDIGLSLDPSTYNRPYSPGSAVLAGSALNAFAQTGLLQKQRDLEAKKKADEAAIEHLLGLPLTAFNALPASIQEDWLSGRPGFGSGNPKKQPIPWLADKQFPKGPTLEDITGTGLAPTPEQPPVYGPVQEGSPNQPHDLIPGRPPVPPGLSGDALMQAIYAHTGTTPPVKPLNDLQRSTEAINRLYESNLAAGKTREGGTPSGQDFANPPWYLDPKYKNTPEGIAAAKAAATNAGGGDTSWIGSYVRTTRGGKKFLDISQITGKDHAAALRYASDQGIPALGSADIGQLQDIASAQANVEGVLSAVDGLLPTNAHQRIAAYPGITLSALLQTNAKRAAFRTWRTSAIRTLRAEAGSKGLRINQKEIELAVQNEIPELTDTYDVVQQKMEYVRQMLANAENPILNQDWGSVGGASKATQADKDYVKSLGLSR